MSISITSAALACVLLMGIANGSHSEFLKYISVTFLGVAVITLYFGYKDRKHKLVVLRKKERASVHSALEEHIHLRRILEDEAQALAFLEAARWPDGCLCPHCGSDYTFVSGTRAVSAPLHKCRRCEGLFNVRTGSVMQESSLPLGTWLRALWLLETEPQAATARGMSRLLPVSHVSAWKLLKRVQAARLGEARWERYKSAPEPDPSTDELRTELKKALRPAKER